MPALPRIPHGEPRRGAAGDRRRARLTADPDPRIVAALADRLARAGCVAAAEEAAELIAACRATTRRCSSRSWTVDSTGSRWPGSPVRPRSATLTVRVDPGVYVPRWQSIALAAARRRPPPRARLRRRPVHRVRRHRRRARRPPAPTAHVVATDRDARAVACARANGVEAAAGRPVRPAAHLARATRRRRGGGRALRPVARAGLPPERHVAPRGPGALRRRARRDGRTRRVISGAPRFLRTGGALLLEVGGEQADLLEPVLGDSGFVETIRWTDEDGDLRGIETTLRGSERRR